MNESIKNFIEEGEKEFKEDIFGLFCEIDEEKGDTEGIKVIMGWHSYRQISLIKMIVEMVESEKKETRFLDNGTMSVVGNWANPVFNSALDTISSKLKEVYEEKISR